MDSALDWHAARALLEWQIELGVSETIGNAPVNRFEIAAAQKAAPVKAKAPTPPPEAKPDPVVDARVAAKGAQSLEALRAAMADYPHCGLKRGARSLVFSDGLPEARLMIIGEAPGRDEDLQGRPFVGRAGQLLDRMLAAIDMGRDQTGAAGVYITNVLPWRPPQNRDPKPDEIDMMKPFLERHVALAAPDVIVLMGNISCQAVLGQRGITRMRGQWTEAMGRPVLPMFHPSYLLRNPIAKREAWADLLALKARLSGGEP
jgi:DNA polymerase